MVKQNFYQLKVNKIKNLIANNQIDEALNQLNEELSYSYVPLKYETVFSEMLSNLMHEKRAQETPHWQLNSTAFIEYLWSNDTYKLTKAISIIDEINLQPLQTNLKKWIEDSNHNHWIAKIYILEAMAEQGINIDIYYQQHLINPRQFGSIFSKPQVINLFQEIERLTHKKVYLINAVFQNLKAYLLVNYPRYKFPKGLALTLVNVTEHMFNPNIQLSDNEKNIFKQIKNIG